MLHSRKIKHWVVFKKEVFADAFEPDNGRLDRYVTVQSCDQEAIR